MGFKKGDEVEVCSKEPGFFGSYYEATVLKRLDANFYAVRYKNLLEDDESRPLVESVSTDEIRPLPPGPTRPTLASGFFVLDKVDAFDNDGWWVGKITGTQGFDSYFVYFETTGDEIPYHVSRLRHHQDWVRGKWV